MNPSLVSLLLETLKMNSGKSYIKIAEVSEVKKSTVCDFFATGKGSVENLSKILMCFDLDISEFFFAIKILRSKSFRFQDDLEDSIAIRMAISESKRIIRKDSGKPDISK